MSIPNNTEAVITLKDIFTMVTKMVGQQEAIHQRNINADDLHRDHELRLRALERWRYTIPVSFFIALSSIATGVFALLEGHP